MSKADEFSSWLNMSFVQLNDRIDNLNQAIGDVIKSVDILTDRVEALEDKQEPTPEPTPEPAPEPTPEPTPTPTPDNGATFLKPYFKDSIWKLKVPDVRRVSGAFANHNDRAFNAEETIWFDCRDRSVVKIRVYSPKTWRDRCGSGKLQGEVFVPTDWQEWITNPYQRENGSWYTPNNQVITVQPNGSMMVIKATAKCSHTEAAGWLAGPFDLHGDGIYGGRGASRMGHGGEIRPGDLDLDVMPHALSLLPNPVHLMGTINGGQDHPGFRWPARDTDTAMPRDYKGTHPELTMGSLLALPKDFDVSTLKHDLNRKLARTLVVHGGYVTDISAWECTYVAIDSRVSPQFQKMWSIAARDEFLDKIQRNLDVLDFKEAQYNADMKNKGYTKGSLGFY